MYQFVETGQDTSAGDTSQYVGTSTLHERHEAFFLHDLDEAVDGAVVFLGLTRRHHHTSSDGVDRVGDETRSDGHGIAERERKQQARIIAQHDRLERVVEAEIAATVDDNAHARDDETSVQAGNTVRRERLSVDVDETVELTFAAAFLGRLGVVGQTGTCVVERVDETQRHRASHTARRDVLAKRNHVRVRFGRLEGRFNFVLECKVQRLRWEITNTVGQIAAPERVETLRAERTRRTVDNALVRLADFALFQHFGLILHKQFHSLNRSRDRFRYNGRRTAEQEILYEA